MIAPLTWEAVATLATGFAAVCAATLVALKQSSIVRRQVELQELQLRHELFDRRSAVFNDVREYLATILYGGMRPDFPLYERFSAAIQSARFLFRPSLYLELRALEAFMSEYLALFDRADQPEEDRRLLRSQSVEVAPFNRRLIELERHYDALPVLFAPDLRLFDQADGWSNHDAGRPSGFFGRIMGRFARDSAPDKIRGLDNANEALDLLLSPERREQKRDD